MFHAAAERGEWSPRGACTHRPGRGCTTAGRGTAQAGAARARGFWNSA